MQKPRHPLSAYNLFFQLERKRIVEHGLTYENIRPISAADICLAVAENKTKKASTAGAKKKYRVHRKTHGKIGFLQLAKAISTRWKEVDPALKQLLEAEATIDKQNYAQKIKIWREQEEQRRTSCQEHKVQILSKDNDCMAYHMSLADVYASNCGFVSESPEMIDVLTLPSSPSSPVQHHLPQVAPLEKATTPFKSQSELHQAVSKTIKRERLLKALQTLAEKHGFSQAEALQSLRRKMQAINA